MNCAHWFVLEVFVFGWLDFCLSCFGGLVLIFGKKADILLVLSLPD